MPIKTTCLCGVPVLTATKIIGWILLALTIIQILIMVAILQSDSIREAYIKSDKTHYESADLLAQNVGFSLVEYFIFLILLGLLLIGCYRRESEFFWPYLVYTYIKFIMISILLVICLIGICCSVAESNEILMILTISMAARFLIADILTVYFQLIVVNRARKVLLAEKNGF